MMRRILTMVTALVMLAAGVPVANAATIEDASGYLYPYVVDDPEGDHEGILGAPNDANPENDILGFDVTDDADTFVMRFRMASVDFEAPGLAAVSVQLTGPGGEDWHVQVSYESGGANPSAGDPDPSSGDPDVLMPGVTPAVDAENHIVYIFADKAAAELDGDATVQFDLVDSGRGVGQAGVGTLTFPELDTVDAGGTTYTMQDGAFPPPPEVPDFTVHHEDLAAGSDSRDLLDLNGTHDVYRYNFTNEAANVTFDFGATVLNGSVAVALVDAADNTLLANTYVDDSNDTLALTNQTAGDWTLEINFTGFSGDVSFSLFPTPAEGTGSDDGDGGTGDDGSDGGDRDGSDETDGGAGNATGNATDAEGEDSPALAVSVVLIGLLIMAVRHRR